MIIDSHQHFWKFNPVRDKWIDDAMQVIRKDFLPKDLKPILETNNVDGCIAVQADQSEKETQFLLDLAAKNEFIKGIVGWVDLSAENVESRLAFFSKNSKFKGVRHIVQLEPNGFMLNRSFQHGISKLNQFGLTYDILIGPYQLLEAIELVAKFPNQKFVLDHIGKPNISKGVAIKWKKEIQELAQHHNVFCKLSGMTTETNEYKWEEEHFFPFIDIITDSFGSERIMYGSDWPVCLLASSYTRQFNIINQYINRAFNNISEKIMGLNAMHFYNI